MITETVLSILYKNNSYVGKDSNSEKDVIKTVFTFQEMKCLSKSLTEIIELIMKHK